jgi:hypothetical protein
MNPITPDAYVFLDNDSELPRVYLAGKIRKNCWRHRLVSGLRAHHWSLGPLPQERFTYIGPFFVGCDHGCFHRPNSHGNRTGSGIALCPTQNANKREIARLCRESVGNADLVFCFIDSLDCFGTLAEIERAHTLGIRVVIAFAPGIASANDNDMWFVCTSANRVHYNVSECKLPALLKRTIKELAW